MSKEKTSEKRGRGQPKLPESEKRQPIMVRFNVAERKKAEQLAKKSGLKLSAYIRQKAIGEKFYRQQKGESNVVKSCENPLVGGLNQTPVEVPREVPREVAICPECGGSLEASVNEWDAKTKLPTTSGIQIDCEFEDTDHHRFFQSDWQAIVDKVNEWANAVDV